MLHKTSITFRIIPPTAQLMVAPHEFFAQSFDHRLIKTFQKSPQISTYPNFQVSSRPDAFSRQPAPVLTLINLLCVFSLPEIKTWQILWSIIIISKATQASREETIHSALKARSSDIGERTIGLLCRMSLPGNKQPHVWQVKTNPPYYDLRTKPLFGK